jgi:CheY-like chemotaxis protein
VKTQSRPASGVIQKWIDLLLVEDDDDCRATVSELLSEHDCLVRSVCTAQAARLAVIDGVPDVIVTDLHLASGPPGWALARAFREEPRTEHVGLIAISGCVEPLPTVTRPFDAYLRKPVEVSLLVGLVKQLAAVSRATRRSTRPLAF